MSNWSDCSEAQGWCARDVVFSAVSSPINFDAAGKQNLGSKKEMVYKDWGKICACQNTKIGFLDSPLESLFQQLREEKENRLFKNRLYIAVFYATPPTPTDGLSLENWTQLLRLRSTPSGSGLWIWLHSLQLLPPQIQHPSHPKHPLSLHPKPPPVFPFLSNQVWCDACRKTNLSFTFHCNGCAFNIDIDCASLIPTLNCQLHDHPLALFNNLSIDHKCQVCGSLCNFFVLRCVPCNFNVHVQCVATLPQTVQISCHRHPLTLTDSLFEDDSDVDEFVCDACEQERKPGQSVYHCEECHFVAHVYCGVSEILPTLFRASEEDQGGAAVYPILARLDNEIRILRCESAMLAGKLAEVTRKLKELDEKRMELVATALSRRITPSSQVHLSNICALLRSLILQ
ncbi:uncharacterized protein LOC132314743 [Cornus florida]|uniref:uncharacterized protein LOC132314743 n=1 Tax=Cornus florida TaxID=4283 RepID=UPI002899DC38|nr:uncharacterized protein LOC132314743 [Cornus florida]